MPFESPDYLLSDLMKNVESGKIQLPDFQREWKWEDDRIAQPAGLGLGGTSRRGLDDARGGR